MQAIDVLATSIEYGLDGLTKVYREGKMLANVNYLAFAVVCAVHERIDCCGHSV